MRIPTEEEIKMGMVNCSGCHTISMVTSLYPCPHCDRMFCEKCSVPYDGCGQRICISCKSNIYLMEANQLYERNNFYTAYEKYKKAADLGNSEALDKCEELRNKLNIK